jgi:hypothetical protein
MSRSRHWYHNIHDIQDGLLQNTTEWLKDVTNKQSKRAIHEDPAFLVEEIVPKMEAIQKEYSKVKAISKPRKVLYINDPVEEG